MRQVVLDTETTGLKVEENHRVIEIGCVELINRKVTGSSYHQYINPQRAVEEGALAIHGLSNEFLINKPLFTEIAQEFMNFIKGAELIIHNAIFDLGFINKELSLTYKKPHELTEYCRVIDTLVLARQLHVGQRNSLDALCKRYKIDNSQRDLHGALLDAHLLAQVYLAMTGGQGSLFDKLQMINSEKKAMTNSTTPIIQVRKLLTLKASQEEICLHEKKLASMLEKSKCLWHE
jgi:DNA polymerase-3 subunit epsilon